MLPKSSTSEWGLRIMKIIFDKIEKLSLKNRLIILIFSLFAMLCAAITGISMAAIRQEMAREAGESQTEILKQIGERMRIVKSNMQTVSNLYYNDSRVREILCERQVLSYDDMKYLYALDIRYAYAFKTIGIDYYAALISKNGAGYYSQNSGADPSLFVLNDPRRTTWYEKVQKEEGKIVWISSFNISKEPDKPKYVYSATRAFNNKEDGSYSGMLMVNVEERLLYDMYKDLLDGSNVIYVLDEYNNIITHPDQTMLGKELSRDSRLKFPENQDYKKENGMLLSRFKDPNTSWTIVEENPISNVYAPIRRVETTLVIIAGLALLCAFGVVVVFARSTVRPLNELCGNIERVGLGELKLTDQKNGWKEIQRINHVFNQMVTMLSRLMENIKEKEKQKRKSDLEYLRAQITPHFIYNTLFSIKCMVAMDKNEQAEDMIDEFIRLLKSKLDVSEEYIKISEEAEGLKGYLNLQKMRYPSDFTDSIRIEGEAENCKIPRMILQPLVENAIFHGIEPSRRPCRLDITVRRKKDRLIIEVLDTGTGISEENIEKIWSREEDAKGTHIGVQNVDRRIRLYFGEEYGMKIYSRQGRWTKSVVLLPIVE